jgi:hypothetical protein
VVATGGIELPIATDPADMARPTDHDGWSLYLQQCVLPALDQGLDRPSAAWTPTAPGRSCSWWHEIIGYPDHDVQSTA